MRARNTEVQDEDRCPEHRTDRQTTNRPKHNQKGHQQRNRKKRIILILMCRLCAQISAKKIANVFFIILLCTVCRFRVPHTIFGRAMSLVNFSGGMNSCLHSQGGASMYCLLSCLLSQVLTPKMGSEVLRMPLCFICCASTASILGWDLCFVLYMLWHGRFGVPWAVGHTPQANDESSVGLVCVHGSSGGNECPRWRLEGLGMTQMVSSSPGSNATANASHAHQALGLTKPTWSQSSLWPISLEISMYQKSTGQKESQHGTIQEWHQFLHFKSYFHPA